MKSILKRWYGVIAAVSIMAAFMAGSVSQVDARNFNPGVAPPNAKAYGMTYGEWSARWWQWAFSLPVDQNPFFDTCTDEDPPDCTSSCTNGANGQFGPVWFLTGVINESGTAVRNCTVPAGKALFFPILNVECSTIEGNACSPIGDNCSEKDQLSQLGSCIESYMAAVIPESLEAEVDGEPIQNLEAYRTLSPLFTFGPLPEDNVLQLWGFDAAEAGATSRSLGDGYYLMLHPLPVGPHTIHFTGSFGGDFPFTLDITYNLNVVPGRP